MDFNVDCVILCSCIQCTGIIYINIMTLLRKTIRFYLQQKHNIYNYIYDTITIIYSIKLKPRKIFTIKHFMSCLGLKALYGKKVQL